MSACARPLLSRLEGVKRVGQGWRARCPAHGGHSDSLAIAESESGRVLVRCHAGCATAAVMEAVGLTLSDLSPIRDRGRRANREDAAEAASALKSAKRRRDAEESLRHKEAAARAVSVWDAARDANPAHPYLCAKRVNAHGIREIGGHLLVPMRDGESVLWNVQRIGPNGSKLFQAGARKRGLWHLLGGPVVDVLCIAEGYATAASVHSATSYPVAVAFDAGNLEPVARSLRALHPAIRIIVCADDDAETAARIGRNPGIDAAMAAARAVGGCIARPWFGGAA